MTLEGLNDDFRDLLVELADAGVEFVIVGAFALAFHGAPRASGDIDISCGRRARMANES